MLHRGGFASSRALLQRYIQAATGSRFVAAARADGLTVRQQQNSDKGRALTDSSTSGSAATGPVPSDMSVDRRGAVRFRPKAAKQKAMRPTATSDRRPRHGTASAVEVEPRQVAEQDIAAKENLERRRRALSLAASEMDANAVERVVPDVSRIHALDNVHLTDTCVRQLLPLTGPRGDGDRDEGAEFVPVHYVGITPEEQSIIDHHEKWRRGSAAADEHDSAGTPPLSPATGEALPVFAFTGGDVHSDNDALRRLATGSSTSPAAARRQLQYAAALNPRPIVNVSASLNTRLQSVDDGDEAFVFALYVEGTTLRVARETLVTRLGIENGQLTTVPLATPPRSVATAVVAVAGVNAGSLLGVNLLRHKGFVMRIGNVHRCRWGDAVRLMRHWRSADPTTAMEVTRVIRRCNDSAEFTSAALSTLATHGTLAFRSLSAGGTLSLRLATAFALLAGRNSFKAMLALLDDEAAPPSVVKFLQRPTRDAAHEFVEESKAAGHDASRSIASRLIRVYGASGSSTAALCALPDAVRSRMRLAGTNLAFNAMVARRFRRHGRKVVVGDIVRLAAVQPGSSRLYDSSQVRRVTSADDLDRITISDVVLPLPDPLVTESSDFPSCGGLAADDVRELLEPLGLAWVLPGGLAHAPACIANEFDFPIDPERPGRAMYAPLWTDVRVDSVVVEHDAPAQKHIEDARFILLQDRALLTAGCDVTAAPSSECPRSRFPLRAAQDPAAASSEAAVAAGVALQPSAPSALLPALEDFTTSQCATLPPRRARAEVQEFVPEGWLTDVSPSAADAGGGGDGSAGPELLTLENYRIEYQPTVGSDVATNTTRVVSAAVAMRGTQDDMTALLREGFVLRGVEEDPEVALQTTVHNVVTLHDSELDYALADCYCPRCGSLSHTKRDPCPDSEYAQRRTQNRRKASIAMAKATAIERGTTLRIARSSASEPWGLKLKASGELIGVVAGSPAHSALVAAVPRALPQFARGGDEDADVAIGEAAASQLQATQQGVKLALATAASGRVEKETAAARNVHAAATKATRVSSGVDDDAETRSASTTASEPNIIALRPTFRHAVLAAQGIAVSNGAEIAAVLQGAQHRDSTEIEIVVRRMQRRLKDGHVALRDRRGQSLRTSSE